MFHVWQRDASLRMSGEYDVSRQEREFQLLYGKKMYVTVMNFSFLSLIIRVNSELGPLTDVISFTYIPSTEFTCVCL